MPDTEVRILRSEVHVWTVRLIGPAGVNHVYRDFLSPEETTRADRFAFEHLRRSYELSQGGMRMLLAHYLDCHPRDVEFTFGPRGKPALRDGRIRFNMAHSSNLAIYAFTQDCEIGIDIEKMRSIPDLEQIADRYFCSAERSEVLSNKDSSARHEAFFRCWTRKEAYVKAVGTGLYLPLNQFQTTLSSNDQVRFMHTGNDIDAAGGWTIQHLETDPGYVGALAYQAEAHHVVFREPVGTQQLLHLFGHV